MKALIRKKILRGLLPGALVSFSVSIRGVDWPQYRGPTHDGKSTDRITKQWSGAVTNPAWRFVLTNCLGGFVVSGGRAFTQTVRATNGEPKEVCVALSITNGTELWTTAVDTINYPDLGVGTDDGPRTTPAVDGGSVFVFSSYLKIYRLNATNGAVIWEKDMRSLYGSSIIRWQNAASPLLEGDLIFLNANAGTSRLMALRTSDGSLAWRSQNEAMTHSTPILTTIHGVRQVIFATQSGLVSLDPSSGNRLWKFTYPFTYSESLAVSPVVCEDMVFVCGAQAYGMGSVVTRVSLTNNTWTTNQLWANTSNSSTLASHWMTPVCYQGFLYGQFGVTFQYDSPNAQLKCVDMRTGIVKWSTNGFGRAATILVDDHLVTLTERGDLVLVAPNTNTYTELGRFKAIPNYHGTTNKCWNGPAICDGRVFVRSTAYAACFDLSMPDLKLDSPQLIAPNRLQLTIRTATSAPVGSNRLAGMEVRAATNLGQALSQWITLTNDLVLSNGVVRIDNVDSVTPPQRFFIVREQD